MGSIVIWGMEAGVLRYVSNLPYGIYTRCGAFPGYLRIPLQIDQWFHGKSTTDSTANRPVAPRQIDHLSWRAPTGGGGV